MDVTKATFQFGLLVTGTIDLNLPAPSGTPDPPSSLGAGRESFVLTPTTTPKALKAVGVALALTAGAQTIDLQSIPQGNAPNVDLTGKIIG